MYLLGSTGTGQVRLGADGQEDWATNPKYRPAIMTL